MRPAGKIEVPSAWENLRFSAVGGTILVVGATDTGKTTFARYLYHRLGAHHERLAFVDGDIGQATLGPPTTMTLALSESHDDGFPPGGCRFRAFVGDISPCAHMLPTVVAAHKLVQKAREEGATAIVFDTTGLVAPSHGGGALKRALVDLLRPEIVVALQRGSELEHLLVPLRRGHRTRVIDRPVVEAVQRRDVEARQKHRAQQFRRSFETAETLAIDWFDLAVIPAPSFTHHRLVALEDKAGFALALGIVTGIERSRHTVELRTPLCSLEEVDALHVGDLAVDPHTFRDRRLCC
jgi:polynucleotide 5'-hydroxyl-kinase GRC3/NOL9